MSKVSILDYFGRTNTSNIHAFGWKATLCLEKKINCKPSEKILEFGFGTGNTLVYLASKNPATNFYGVDISEIMLKTTRSRIKFSGLKNQPQLHLIKEKMKFPFENNFFDKVYIESVLGILEVDDLNFVLTEIARILKPSGKIVFNETIWLSTTSLETIEWMNRNALADFGIKQASSDFPYANNWKELLHRHGFMVERVVPLNEIITQRKTQGVSFTIFRSDLFSYLGKMKGCFNSKLRRDWKKFQKIIEMNNKQEQTMEGWLFEASLKK